MAENNNVQIANGAVVAGATGPRIILALDYGVLFTSLAHWQSDGSPVDPDRFASQNPIVVFREWPGASLPRVPSEISYSPTSPDKCCSQWGWSIEDDSRVLKYAKLELEPQSTMEELLSLRTLIQGLDLIEELRTNKDIALMNDVPIHLTKNAEDVVTDYLSNVTRVWWQYMRSQGRYTLERVPLDLVITYPDRWSYETMNKLYRAVQGAFPSAMFPTLRNISFVSEMECWTLHTIQEMRVPYHDTLIPGECFVICNVAPHKAEAVSCCIDKLEPLEISRSGMHSKSLFGQDCIDCSFLKFIQCRILNLDLDDSMFGSRPHRVMKSRSQVLLERFERIRHAFNGTGGSSLTIPRGTRVAPGFEDTIVNGIIHFTEQDVKDLFSGTLNGILQLLARQITKVRSTNHNGMKREVTKILMTGELSENEYIFNEVTKFANRRGNCQVQRADDCLAGAVKGAVLRRIGIRMAAAPPLRVCRRHYGISTYFVDDGSINYNDKREPLDQITWLVRQGDMILPDQAIVSKFTFRCRIPTKQERNYSKELVTFIATSDEESATSLTELLQLGASPPVDVSDHTEVAYVGFDLGSIIEDLQQEQKGEDRRFDRMVDLEAKLTVSSEVCLEVKYIDQILGSFSTVL